MPYKNKNNQKAWRQRYYHKNKKRIKINNRKWGLLNQNKVKKYRRKYHLKHKFGITQEQYIQLLNSQNCKCFICGRLQVKIMHIDHNHKTGEIRGLLCFKCNTALGCVDDKISILKQMINYLEKSNDHKTAYIQRLV